MDPLMFEPDYTADITEEDINSLNTDDAADLLVRVIVTVPEDPYDMTANLPGPLVLNPISRLAKQIINLNQRYITKHKVIKPSQAATKA